MAAGAVEFLQHLAALGHVAFIAGGRVDVFERDRLGHQTEDECHHRLAALGLGDPLARGILVVGLALVLACARNWNCGMPQAVVPRTDTAIVVRNAAATASDEEPLAAVVLEALVEVFVVGRLAVLVRGPRLLLARPGLP